MTKNFLLASLFLVSSSLLAQQPIVGSGGGGGVTSVSDSSTIDFTLALPNLTGSVICSPAADNLIVCSLGGIFADEDAAAHVYDNTVSGLVATNVQSAIDELAASAVFTASNGLTLFGTDVRLGGALTQDTTVDGAAGSFNIQLTNLSTFVVDVTTISGISISSSGPETHNVTGGDFSALVPNGDVVLQGQSGFLTAISGDLVLDSVGGDLELQGVSSVQLRTPAVVGATATVGQVPVLQNAATGVIEYENVLLASGVTDTNSVNLTYTAPGSISADVIIDPAADNLLQSLAGGLFADEDAAAHVYDNTASSLTATNVQAAIDEIANLDAFFAVDGSAPAAWQDILGGIYREGRTGIGWSSTGMPAQVFANESLVTRGSIRNLDASQYRVTGDNTGLWEISNYPNQDIRGNGTGTARIYNQGTVTIEAQSGNQLAINSGGILLEAVQPADQLILRSVTGELRIQPAGTHTTATAGDILMEADGAANGRVEFRTPLQALSTRHPGSFVGDSIYWNGSAWVTGGPPALATAPACTAAEAGARYRDTDASNTDCYCDGTSWLPAAGAGPCA
jgi:hypothetical protein